MMDSSTARIGLTVNGMEYINSASQTLEKKFLAEAVSRESHCCPTQFHKIQTMKNSVCQTTHYCQEVGKILHPRVYSLFDDNFYNKAANKIQRWWKTGMIAKKLLFVIDLWKIFCQEQKVEKEYKRKKAIREAQDDKTKRLYPHTKEHLDYWEMELKRWKQEQLQKIQNTSDLKLKRKVNLEVLECESKLYRELFHRMHVYHKKRIIERRVEKLERNAKPLEYVVPTDTPDTLYAASLLEQYNSILSDEKDVIDGLRNHKNKEIQLLSIRESEFRKRDLQVSGIRHRLGYAFYKFAESSH